MQKARRKVRGLPSQQYEHAHEHSTVVKPHPYVMCIIINSTIRKVKGSYDT